MAYYRVVEWGSGDKLNVLSISLSTYEEALSFKNSDFNRVYHSDAFIIQMFFENTKE